MKVTIELKLPHTTHPNGTISVSDSDDVPFEDIETTDDAETVVTEALYEVLHGHGFIPDSFNVSWEE